MGVGSVSALLALLAALCLFTRTCRAWSLSQTHLNLKKVDVAVCTIEKANALLNRALLPTLGAERDLRACVRPVLIVADEIHTLSVPQRYVHETAVSRTPVPHPLRSTEGLC